MQQRTLNASGHVRFHCNVHGAAGGGGMSGVVAVGDANAAPTIAVQRDTAAPAAGQPVAFRAVASDPERLALRIDWDMDGDGTFERLDAGKQRERDLRSRRMRTVRARATDDLGLTAAASHAFTVPAADPGPGQPPRRSGRRPPAGTLPPDTLAPAVSVSAPRGRSARAGCAGAASGCRSRRRRTRSSWSSCATARAAGSRGRPPRGSGRRDAAAVRARRARAGRLALRIVAIDPPGTARRSGDG